MTINLKELKDISKDHFPVLINEMLDYLSPESGKTYVDATFGAGGYSRAILEKTKAKVIAIDRDISVEKFATSLKEEFSERFIFKNSKNSEIAKVLKEEGIDKVDGIVIDLGLSTMQIKNDERGFSFKGNGELSMAMGLNKFSAKDFINKAKEEEIADVLYFYGEEWKAKQIAKQIVLSRKIKKIETTFELANIIRSIVKGGKIDPATKSFQAIRIHINDELKELTDILNVSVNLLNNNGKLVVVSFHSLEDRIVKNFFQKLEKEGNYKILTKKVVKPTLEEIKINKASSSAKLRAIERVK